MVAPYKRVILSASHIHQRKRHKDSEWSSRHHLEECLRQHRAYFRRRGVATSLDMDPNLAFGDKGVTGTANDRDVFLAFMKKIGLEDAASPNSVAAAVIKLLRQDPLTEGQDEGFYGRLFEAMARKPGQNVERQIFDEAVEGTDVEARAEEVYQKLCDYTKKRYDALNEAISRAHRMLQVSLTLEKDGIARFALNNPFGMAIPYEGSLFRVYELDDSHHVARVCPPFFTITGGEEDDSPFTVHAVANGGFDLLDSIEKFRIGEVFLPATVAQLERVGQFAIEHCEFDVAELATDSAEAIGAVLNGSGGAIRTRRLSMSDITKRKGEEPELEAKPKD
jgi:hypothetical protein